MQFKRFDPAPDIARLTRERNALAEIARAVGVTFANRRMPPIAASIVDQVLDRVEDLDAELRAQGTPVLFRITTKAGKRTPVSKSGD